MQYNNSPISLREGSVYIDGVQVMDMVNFTLNFTPDVWSGKQVGDKTNSSRWLGYNISGTITRRRATNWLSETIKNYIKTGETPEIKISGIMNDTASDFYKIHGEDAVTVLGVVLTGDLSMLQFDAAGDVKEDSIAFNARKIA